MRSVFFIPPLRHLSGGLSNIYRIALELTDLGYQVRFTCPGQAPGMAETCALSRGRITVLPWDQLKGPVPKSMRPSKAGTDLFVIPEGWPNAISVGNSMKARVLVYAQSWNFLLTSLPDGVQWSRLPVTFLANSRPVAWFIEKVLGMPVAGVLPPAVDSLFFRQDREGGQPQPKTPPKKRTVNIAWLSRKNRALSEQVRQVATAALAHDPGGLPVEWQEVRHASLEEVSRVFSQADIFLNTSYPEGFGLPSLEAMACGCVPVGCTGFGGWEYMRQVDPDVLFSGQEAVSGPPEWRRFQQICQPPFPLEDGREGNGFFFNDGDIIGTGLGLAAAVRFASSPLPGWDALRLRCRETAAHYSQEVRRQRLDALWKELALR